MSDEYTREFLESMVRDTNGNVWDSHHRRMARLILEYMAIWELPYFNLYAHLERQMEWSQKTFGPGPRPEGIVDHIRKELCEVLEEPTDVEEWIDVVILALDGAWRSGHSPEQIIKALEAKQTKNEGRNWPDWRKAEAGKAIEHTD